MRNSRHLLQLLPGILLLPEIASAHGGRKHSAEEAAAERLLEGPLSWGELWTSWAWEPGVLVGLLLAGWLYARGVRRLWRATRVGSGLRRHDAVCYALGWVALAVALVSPLHPWGEVLFSAHMVQHEVLMLLAAPLLVMGRPLPAFLWALPSGWSRRLARAAAHPGWARLWGLVTRPFVAWLIHALLLWVWHIPACFQATLDNDFLHSAQHFSFLGSALLFWWAVLHGRLRESGYGSGVLYLFTTALHSGALGALLTFSRTPWYPAYSETAAAWGMTALEDQQLGGLIMWIPAGLVYIAAGLALFGEWLRDSERRVRSWEATSQKLEQSAP